MNDNMRPILVQYRVRDIVMWVNEEIFKNGSEFNLSQNLKIEEYNTEKGLYKTELSFTITDKNNMELLTVGFTMEGVFQCESMERDDAVETYRILHALCQEKMETLCSMARLPRVVFPYEQNILR